MERRARSMAARRSRTAFSSERSCRCCSRHCSRHSPWTRRESPASTGTESGSDGSRLKSAATASRIEAMRPRRTGDCGRGQTVPGTAERATSRRPFGTRATSKSPPGPSRTSGTGNSTSADGISAAASGWDRWETGFLGFGKPTIAESFPMVPRPSGTPGAGAVRETSFLCL